ncbi:MAG: hypothetical protein MUF00_00535 [Gemmatimonadaceae bacterium]|jgi:hypothetical protein|nr:hypothetical protein [Gemmatimonadaceae bacterium]
MMPETPAPAHEPTAPPTKPLAPGDLTQPIDLRDFMHGVGELMALPPKRPTRPSMHAVPAVAPAPARATRNARAFVLPGVAAVCGLAVVAVQLMRPTPPRELSPLVLGAWTTTNARYAGRSLEITATDVVVGQGARGATERFPIARAVTLERGDSTVVELEYVQEDDATPMRLAVARSAPERLSIANPAGLVWERTRGMR